jgi:hypothetical protein
MDCSSCVNACDFSLLKVRSDLVLEGKPEGSWHLVKLEFEVPFFKLMNHFNQLSLDRHLLSRVISKHMLQC